jgi:serine/threonine-protein kinase RsbW
VGESVRFDVRNTLDAIGPATEAAESWLQQRQIGRDATILALLAIDEIVTNCIKYGYDDADEHVVTIALSVEDQTLKIQVIDDGRPFDPLNAPPPDLSLNIEDREEGGLGIFLLRKLSDGISYERRDEINCLTITKRIS